MIQPRRAFLLIDALTLAILTLSLRISSFAETPPIAEPVYKSHPTVFEARGCRITKVSLTKEAVYVEFTGYWNHFQDFNLPDVDRNSVSFLLYGKSDPALLRTIGPDAHKLIGKKADIVIMLKHAGFTSRGGNPMVFLPIDTSDVKITAAP